MKKITILAMMIGAAFSLSACSFSFSTNGNNASNANTNKPANAANNASNSGNKSNTTSNSNSTKTEIKDEKAKKPTETKKQPNAKTVPAEWVYYSDEARGYGFSLPAGSTEGDKGTTDGVDYFTAETSDKIGVIVYAFKDASLSKDQLLERAEQAWKSLGETLTAGKPTGESEDYKVAEGDSTSAEGKKKVKVLVATDVTDNYVMFVFCDAASYEKNSATMDMIWGSFEMYSGGASGNN